MIWFFGKISVFIFVFIWLRGTLPRLRYDQFMKFGWKFLLPVSIGWILLVATARAFRNEYNWDLQQSISILGLPLFALLVISWIAEEIRERKKKREADVRAEEAEIVFDAFAGGHPVPPMPGQKMPAAPTNSLPAQES
jgi:NADH-quinone oxidoreductase subunit H